MKFRLLLGALLLLTGCVSHYKSATYAATGTQAVHQGNRRVSVALVPSVALTRHANLPERLSSLMFFHYVATGPYSLLVVVQTDGVENGVPVEVTSAELRFASGETRAILSRQAPARQGLTQQRPKQDQYTPQDTFSRCDFIFPLEGQLLFKTDEPVRVVVTVRTDGKPEEMKLEAGFKGAFVEHWGSTLMDR